MVTKSTMNIDHIINLVLSNDLLYPGFHQESSERTKKTMKLLSVNEQLKLIWKTFCEYVMYQLASDISVNVDNLGTFTFSYVNELPTKNSQAFFSSITKPDLLNKKQMIFILSTKYQSILDHYSTIKIGILQPKDILITKPEIAWNPTSVGYSCYLKKEVVYDGINAILKAIYDMVKMKKRVEINTGFCKIIFNKGEMSQHYYSNADIE